VAETEGVAELVREDLLGDARVALEEARGAVVGDDVGLRRLVVGLALEGAGGVVENGPPTAITPPSLQSNVPSASSPFGSLKMIALTPSSRVRPALALVRPA